MNIEKIKPESWQESVWDYPRPPRIENVSKSIKVIFDGIVIAETIHAKRVLETANAPAYYIPPEDVKTELLSPAENKSYCEWKGEASYYHLNINNKQVRYACWSYTDPVREFEEIKNYIAFYAQKMDACYIDDELVTPQPGKFYGGWITKNITGPFKGAPGTESW